VSRPTKLAPALQESLLSALRAGATRQAAAAHVGIDRTQLWRWTERFATFRNAVERAEADAEVRHTATIMAAANNGDWRASAFWLEHRRPQEWGLRAKLEAEVNINLPDLLRRGLMARQDDFPEPTMSPVVSIPDVLNARNGASGH
jgi:hypothetical protein